MKGAAAPPPPPALPIELVEEILLRLPPQDPACLLSSSLVCKTWGAAISHPGFRRRLHELHQTPPVLGLLHNLCHDEIPRFIPTTASSFSLAAAPDRRSWWALDCRHGRVLFFSKGPDTNELLVCEPITGGAQRRIPVPVDDCPLWPSAAVLCAADGPCGHNDCHGGPFHLVFVFPAEEGADAGEHVTSACQYSSETGAWGELTSVEHGDFDFTFSSSVLVGRSLLYFMSDDGWILEILEYDLARNNLNVLDPPGPGFMRSNLMLAEDGGLGLIHASDTHLNLWSRKASGSTDAQWVLSRVIYLEALLPNGALVDAATSLHVLGYAEGANVMFVTTVVGLFSIELQSQRVRKACDDHGFSTLIPVVSFYTPLLRALDSPRVRCYEKVASTLKKIWMRLAT